MGKRTRIPQVGDVYAIDGKHRRVIGVVGTSVYYSVGGDKNRTCCLATFKRWVRHAALLHSRQKGEPNEARAA